MTFKRCRFCGAYLDPGEWCRCDEHDQPEAEESRRPLARRRKHRPDSGETETNEVRHGEV